MEEEVVEVVVVAVVVAEVEMDQMVERKRKVTN